MKKVIVGVAALACIAMTSCGNMGQVLGAMTNGTGVINAVSSVIGLDKVKAQNLIATWKYAGPGCAFTSENLLAKAGGEVAATKIEQELLPYFDKTGLNASNTYVTFNEDMTFTLSFGGKTFSGTWSMDEANAKITMSTLLLSFNCYAKREYRGISLLFESKKLLNILQVLAAMSGNDTVSKIGELSKNYDGVRLGFDMKR